MSLDIDPKIERELTELAGLKNVTVNALLREFTADQKRYLQELTEDTESLEAMRKGEYIDQDIMLAKMDGMIEQAKTLANKQN